MSNYMDMRLKMEYSDYDRHFWNAMRGKAESYGHMDMGRDTATGNYVMAPVSDDKFAKARTKESLFRQIATNICAYGSGYRIWAKDTNDLAVFVPEGGEIPLESTIHDFTAKSVDSHKLAVFVKTDEDFIQDASFDFESYLTARLAKNFGRAEENGFINGTGDGMPTGILVESNGADIGVTTDFVCATYRKQKGKCTSHQIHNVQVEQILLTEINRMLAFVRERESEFVELLTKKNERDLNRQFRECSRELEQATQRITKLDSIIQRLYEDNLDGKISDERFAKMTATYEQEQKDLQARVITLREALTKAKAQRLNIDSFLAQVRKYTEVKELDAEIIRALVERIDVFKPEKVPGTRTKKQTIRIHWNFIGAVELPKEPKKSA